MQLKRPLMLCVLSLLLAPLASAEYLTSYFTNTKPGSWASYEVTSTDAKGKSSTSTATLKRLPDEAGLVVMEFETGAGGGDKGMTLQVHADPAVLEAKNPLDYMSHAARLIIQPEGQKAREMPMQMLAMMGGAALKNIDYASNVEHVGSEEVDGRDTEHYRVSGETRLKIMFKEIVYGYESEIWLSEEVPFGRVKERSLIKDDKGKTTSRSESRLLDSGTSGAQSAISGEIEKVELPPMFGK